MKILKDNQKRYEIKFIINEKQKSLFLSRDPFGEKPLFYFHDSHGFFFGSEIN